MTSLHSTKASVPALTYYIVENGGGYMLNSLNNADTRVLSANTVLADMGKTVVVDGYVYRKVQVTTVNNVVVSGALTGYICLNSDEAPLFDGDNQGVSKLN